MNDRTPSLASAFLSLFASLTTLICCALPALLVLVGLGATMASLLAAAPWLVALSRHKEWVFGASGVLLLGNAYTIYRLGPRLAARGLTCSPEEADACARAASVGRRILWVSAAVYAIGAFVAYPFGPLLVWLSR